MKILISGHAGFIGSHLVDRLLKDGHQIIGIDNFSMGKLENLPKNKNLITVDADILDDIGNFFDDIDIVFHLAALTRPRESFTNPIETNTVNVEGTLKMLLRAKEHNVKKFVFVSSASAYGYQERYPFYEKSIMNPASPYASTKLIGEVYCKMFQKITDMKINIVRPFNVYGKRQDPNGPYAAAAPKFIDTLKRKGQPFITGDGKQFRDFIYVEDVVDLMVKLSESEVKGEVFNAGSGKHTSINSLYETICGIMKKDVLPAYLEKVDDPNTLASVEKAERLLKWRPKYSLVEGLAKIT